MSDFILKNVNADLENELEVIGFDKSYLHKAVDKYHYKNIKIFGLTIPQATILKQAAISFGADCALHRETITSKVENTDCLLGGSFSQLRKISQKLRCQPFSLAKLADEIEKNIDIKLAPIKLRETVFNFDRPYIVGVLNLTPNSFSDGGEFFDFEKACNHLLQLIEDGADIIDIGAESTKPFSSPVEPELQLQKILPILNFIKAKGVKTPTSIDTRSAKVAQSCIDAGADIINDVSGLTFDSEMVKVIAKNNATVIIQHSKGTPENMQVKPTYTHLIDEIYLDLKQKIDFAINNGINKEKIIVDPGIGFGKTKEQNYEIINRLDEFSSLGVALMLGVSRKSLLGMPEASNELKDVFTVALNSRVLEKKVNFIRVHNVKLHKELIQTQIIKY